MIQYLREKKIKDIENQKERPYPRKMLFLLVAQRKTDYQTND